MTRALLAAAVLLVALGGCSDDSTADADRSTEPAAGPLEAAFSYDVELAEGGPTNCPVAQIRFTDESTGDPTAWSWTFEDAPRSTEQNPIVFREVYEATLTITRGDETDTVTQPVSFAVC